MTSDIIVNNIYELSPVQQGMLFHDQFAPGTGVYVVHFVCSLSGNLDEAAFRRAWQFNLDRYDILRTAFHWHDLEKPLQVVHQEVELPFDTFDWRSREPQKKESSFDAALEADRKRGFQLTEPPLMRCALYRMDDDRWEFVWTFHHLLLDGWSTSLVLQDVLISYEHFRRGVAPRLPETRPFSDYLGWLQRQNLAKAETFWKNALRGCPLPTPLPVSQGEADEKVSSSVCKRSLTAELTTSLTLFAKQQQITLNNILQCAWGVLLSRYSGSEDVAFGITVSGRPAALTGVERIGGMFINTLPLRIHVDPQKPITALLREIHGSQLAIQEFDYSPLINVQRWSGSHQAQLFDSIVVFENYPIEQSLASSQLSIRIENVRSSEKSSFPITLVGVPGAQLTLRIEYDSQQVSQDTAKRLLDQLSQLLSNITTASKVEDLDMLPEEERRKVLLEWNQIPARNYTSGKCLHQLFEERADARPNAIALTFEGQSVTYGELNIRANKLAHYLRELGIKADDRIAICAERGFDMIVAILATLKADAAYVPLDTAYPEDRLRFVLEDSGAMVLLTEAHLKEAFSIANSSIRILTLDSECPEWQVRSTSNPNSDNTRTSNLAYVIYTSGSTGAPKGVLIEHQQATRLFSATNDWFQFNSHDVWTLYHSYAFDFSVWEIWGALLYGGRLVIVPKPTVRSPEDFYELVCREGVTVLNQTPSAFRQFINANESSESKHRLRYVVFGGESLDVAMLKRWYDRNSDDQPRLINMYGITETTVHVTYRPLSRVDTLHTGASPIGRPIPDLQIYILDKLRRPVPVGVVGELYVAGAGVARGYLNRDELTAERFISNPVGADSKARLYKTGDLGRWQSDGSIEYLGRNDFQVKIRGFRVELGEIEATLTKYPGIRDAIVIADTVHGAAERLLAYYTASSGAPSADLLRRYLAESLPEHMMPAAFIHLEALPLTTNGKLDRKALPNPASSDYLTTQYEPPQGDAETALADIWTEVLKIDRVGRHDNFFFLGGHSLLAVTIIERMRRNGFRVDIRQLFATPTIAALAIAADSAESQTRVPANLIPLDCEAITPGMLPLINLSQFEIDRITESVPGGVKNIKDIYPLAPLQEGILFHHLMNPETDAYVLSGLCSVDTRERLDLLREALQLVVDRHDILRTAIHWEGLTEPAQVVLRNAQIQVELVELDSHDGDIAEQMYAKYDPRHLRMDLRQAPLLRVWVAFDDKEQRWLLLTCWHHIIGDHTTMEAIQCEIQAHMEKRAELLPEPVPYRNLVAQARLGVSQDAHEIFFREMLGDVSEPTAPFGLLNVQGDGRNVEESRTEVGDRLALSLRNAARRLGISAASLFHLAWGRVLACLSSRTDVVFGTVLFGRMESGERSDQGIGLFINTLPLRISLGDEGTEASALQTHHLLAELMRHEHAPLALAQRCSKVAAPSPLFTTLLNYRHSTAVLTDQMWEGVKPLRSEERTNYPIMLSVDDWSDGFALTAQTVAGIAPERICLYMLRALESLVDSLRNSPDIPVNTLDITPPSERDLVVHSWNQTHADYPTECCVHELFEEQVRKTPHSTAISYDGETISYRELNHRANQLAHHLLAIGVTPDSRVAICVDRGIEMVVALLGVLKSGGAYVPLDPAYPPERLHYMLQDAGPVALLTQDHLMTTLDSPGEIPIVSLTFERQSCGNQPATNPSREENRLTTANLAYVIYTSGSTGNPKGVLLQHQGVVNFLCTMAKQPGLKSGDKLAAVTTLSFDIAGLELFLPLTVGAEVELIGRETARDGIKLAEVIEHSGASCVQATPATWRMLIEAGWPGAKQLKVLCGGEALPADLAAQLLPRCSELWNMYGPTETTIWSTVFRVEPGFTTPITIGQPIANTEVYILDQNLRPLPVGVPGDLYIGGDGVARGYWKRPELTAEKFIPDPFGRHGARLYHTGDVGRRRHDGFIECLGRADHQVKIRGFRIELGEIEESLMLHPCVARAAVIASEMDTKAKQLVAYVVPADEVDDSQLNAFLRTRLPEYMVPAVYVRLDELPLTPNGKVDRRRLPAPNAPILDAPRVASPPQGLTEIKLASVFAEVLGHPTVGRDENFFDLGGHSLLITRLLLRLRAAFQCDLAVTDIFQNPTVAMIARKLDGQTTQGAEIDFESEATLDESITPTWTETSADSHNSAQILLTGATGFLGMFLLQELIERTPAQIVCLVRAEDNQTAYTRLKQKLVDAELWNPRFEERIQVFAGDLAKPKLGLSSQVFDGLTNSLSSIYHNGAIVNFSQPYSALKPANVSSTIEVLKLCSRGRRKEIHYVSTTAVLTEPFLENAVEEAPLGRVPMDKGAYPQSKWVAERLLLAARERGFPVTIYRPGTITGHSKTGVYNPDDFLYRFLRGCLLLGSAPEIEMQVDLLPVDYIARCIVGLSQINDQLTTYNLAGTQLTDIRNVYRSITSFGLPLSVEPYNHWRERLLATAAEREDHPLSALVGFFPMLAEGEQMKVPAPGLSSRQTQASLKQIDISCPPPDESLLHTYLRRLVN